MKAISILAIFICCGCVSHSLVQRLPSSNESHKAYPMRCETLKNFQVHGHRGSSDRPENMISAFKRGIELGADFVELDLQITRDDQVIVAHDTFMRSNCLTPQGTEVGQNKLFFRNMTLSEVKQYNCGTLKNPEPVATLAEVFSAMKGEVTRVGRLAGINVELKFDSNRPELFPSREVYVNLMLGVLDQSHFEISRLLFQSFDVPILKTLKQERPDLEVSPLLGGKQDVERAVQIAQSLEAHTVTPAAVHLSEPLVRKIQSAGIKVIPWTVNDVLTVEKLTDWQVDGIITDHPEIFGFARGLCTDQFSG